MTDISFNIAFNKHKIAQIVLVNQLFQFLNLVGIFGHGFFVLSRTLMRKSVNNDVSKDSSLVMRRRPSIKPGAWNIPEHAGTFRVRAHFGQSNFSFFHQKRKKHILLILIIFAYFKVQKKREKEKMVRKIDHFFIFLILKLNSKIQKILLTAKSDILLFLFS